MRHLVPYVDRSAEVHADRFTAGCLAEGIYVKARCRRLLRLLLLLDELIFVFHGLGFQLKLPEPAVNGRDALVAWLIERVRDDGATGHRALIL